MSVSTFGIEFSLSALPDGWSGDYKQYAELIASRLTGNVTGDFLDAVIGGEAPGEGEAKPPFFDTAEFNIKFWDATRARYRITGGPPVGSIFPILSVQPTPPLNYLFLTGQLIAQADYPDLFEVIGTYFNLPDDDVTQFRIPDLQGRIIVNAGSGAAVWGESPAVLRNRELGKWFDSTYPFNKETHTNPPADRAKFSSTVLIQPSGNHMIDNLPPSLALNYIIRAK